MTVIDEQDATEALLRTERGQLLEELKRSREGGHSPIGEEGEAFAAERERSVFELAFLTFSNPNPSAEWRLMLELGSMRGRCRELEEMATSRGTGTAELEQELSFARRSWEQAEAEKELLNQSLTELRKSLMARRPPAVSGPS